MLKEQNFETRQKVPAKTLKKTLETLSCVEFVKIASTRSVYVVLTDASEHRIADHTSPRRDGRPFLAAQNWQDDVQDLIGTIAEINKADAEKLEKAVEKIEKALEKAAKSRKNAEQKKQQAKKSKEQEIIEKAAKIAGIENAKSLSVFGKILKREKWLETELRSAKLWGRRWDIMFKAAKAAKK